MVVDIKKTYNWGNVIECMTSVHSNLQFRFCDSNQNHQIAYFIFRQCILQQLCTCNYNVALFVTFLLEGNKYW